MRWLCRAQQEEQEGVQGEEQEGMKGEKQEEQRMQAEDQAWILDICGNFKETRVLQIFVKNRFMRIND